MWIKITDWLNPLSRTLLCTTLALPATSAILLCPMAGASRETLTTPGIIREFPVSLNEIRQAVLAVVGDKIVHGTLVFDKEPILTGADAVDSTPLSDRPVRAKGTRAAGQRPAPRTRAPRQNSRRRPESRPVPIRRQPQDTVRVHGRRHPHRHAALARRRNARRPARMASPGTPGAVALKIRSFRFAKIFLFLFYLASFPPWTHAQAIPYTRSFTLPRPQIEQALKDLQAYSGQKLPVLDGFVARADNPLDRYERGFYQFSIELVPGDAGTTIVRLSVKITAWYAH